jgi:hypothetical protein
MERAEAEELLSDVELVPVLEAPIPDAKRILDTCLAAGLPAVLGRDDHCTKGCAPKLLLLARAEDAPKVGELLRGMWRELVDQEGTIEARGAAAISDEAMPCPACGAAIPNDAAECPDCGLVC